jgi:hypothetical protein
MNESHRHLDGAHGLVGVHAEDTGCKVNATAFACDPVSSILSRSGFRSIKYQEAARRRNVVRVGTRLFTARVDHGSVDTRINIVG